MKQITPGEIQLRFLAAPISSNNINQIIKWFLARESQWLNLSGTLEKDKKTWNNTTINIFNTSDIEIVSQREQKTVTPLGIRTNHVKYSGE